MESDYKYIKQFLDYLDFQIDMGKEVNNVDFSALDDLTSKKLMPN